MPERLAAFGLFPALPPGPPSGGRGGVFSMAFFAVQLRSGTRASDPALHSP